MDDKPAAEQEARDREGSGSIARTTEFPAWPPRRRQRETRTPSPGFLQSECSHQPLPCSSPSFNPHHILPSSSGPRSSRLGTLAPVGPSALK